MTKRKNIFLEKKILIYGLGKSGISSYKFLNNKAKVYLFDDNLKKKINCKLNQRLKDTKEVSQIKFDKIIVSPGIDISNCRLANILKKTSLKFLLTWMFFTRFIKIKVLLLQEPTENLLQQKFYMKF